MSSQVKKPNLLESTINRLDAFQQHHPVLALPYAVIKKYGDDEAGYQAALIAYYGFLSLFPLLIVATAVIQLVVQGDTGLQDRLLASITSYFPALGQNLADSIRTPSRSGLALILGLLITFYGAKGVADAVQHSLNHVWGVPRHKRAGFPKNTLNSFGIIIGCGLGLILAASLTGYATSGRHDAVVRILLWLSGFGVLYSVLWALFTFGSSARKRPFANVPGALLAATAFTLLQALGSFIITRQLHDQRGLNAQFAVVIALLFWMYLQAQVLLYAIELNVVRAYKLWPRRINPNPPIPADKKAYELYRSRETFHVDKPVGH